MSDTAPIEHPTWLTDGDFTQADEPVRLFAAWFAEAKRAEPVNPDAMALATVDASGQPNARMVLLKGFDARGFVFYTNVDSIKGHELAAAPKAANWNRHRPANARRWTWSRFARRPLRLLGKPSRAGRSSPLPPAR